MVFGNNPITGKEATERGCRSARRPTPGSRTACGSPAGREVRNGEHGAHDDDRHAEVVE
jgi:hypothetical protein